MGPTSVIYHFKTDYIHMKGVTWYGTASVNNIINLRPVIYTKVYLLLSNDTSVER